MKSLVGLGAAEIEALIRAVEQPAYRARQIAAWAYRRGARTWAEMTDLPRALRDALSAEWRIGACDVARCIDARDGVRKYLLSLHDGQTIESVYLPYVDRVSVCVSSQVGCAVGCAFCATGVGGLARDLTSGEIVDQVLALQRDNPERRISHVVYMGMGEPLLNYDAVVASIRLLAVEAGISARRLTVSTVGVAPAIRRLAEEDLPVALALSLHAPDDDLRSELVPAGRKWRIAEVLDACRVYHGRTGRNLTFEYILLECVNDAPEQATRLAESLEGLPGNVNLIPYNPSDSSVGFRTPRASRVRAFRAVLEGAGRPTTQRMQRGRPIDAACGQLRRRAAHSAHPSVP